MDTSTSPEGCHLTDFTSCEYDWQAQMAVSNLYLQGVSIVSLITKSAAKFRGQTPPVLASQGEPLRSPLKTYSQVTAEQMQSTGCVTAVFSLNYVCSRQNCLSISVLLFEVLTCDVEPLQPVNGHASRPHIRIHVLVQPPRSTQSCLYYM